MQKVDLPAEFYVVDSTATVFKGDVLLPFALDEVLCRKVGLGEIPPLIHLWRHERAFVMGLRDRKLPYALAAMDWLEQQGYAPTVRNSGGAAVPLDAGVVNLSLILPNPAGRIDFKQDFALMYRLLCESLHRPDSMVQKGEIEGSYCPGDFDVSVNGQKFCGIAQRRQTKAFVVQAFVVVEGKGADRGALVKRFYEVAAGGMEGGSYPHVRPERMASLAELLDIPSVDRFVENVKEVLCRQGGLLRSPEMFTGYEEEIRAMIAELRSRYEKRAR